MGLIRATVEYYRQVIEKMLPRGPVWRLVSGGTLQQLVDALAQMPVRVRGRAVDLLEESDPRTADETLAAWERNLGLPDPCMPTPTTDDERRAVVAAKEAAQGGQSASYFVGVAAAGGFTIEIVSHPYTAPRCGVAECGDELALDTVAYVWRVRAEAALTANERARLECLLDDGARGLGPAHAIAEYVYDL